MPADESEKPAEQASQLKSSKNRVNSLLKGLRVIEALNAHKSLTANDVAALTGTSRGTTYRLLETLREAGYVARDQSSGTYWLEPPVMGLSDGLTLEAWVWQIAVPIMNDLGDQVTWPLSLVTPHGVTMLVRASTDGQSPTTLHYMAVGARMPMRTTAGGLAYLAFCKPSERNLLMELSEKSFPDSETTPGVEKGLLLSRLTLIRDQGYAIHDGGNGVTVLAVPIFTKSQVFAVLAIRFFSSAMRFNEGVRRYQALLQETAGRIGNEFERFTGNTR